MSMRHHVDDEPRRFPLSLFDSSIYACKVFFLPLCHVHDITHQGEHVMANMDYLSTHIQLVIEDEGDGEDIESEGIESEDIEDEGIDSGGIEGKDIDGEGKGG